MPQPHQLIETLDSLIFGLEPCMPIPPGILVERGLRVMPAQAVINLPGDQIGVIAQRFSHGPHKAFAGVPVDVAIETHGPPRAFVFSQTTLINGQDLGVLPREPNRRGGRWRAQDGLDASLAQDIHDPAEPGEIALSLLRFAQPPGELPHAHHVHTGLLH